MGNRTNKIILSVLAVLVIGGSAYLGVKYYGSSHAATPVSCTVNSLLVNTCRPWVGGISGGYTMTASDTLSQSDFADKRLNNPNVLTNPSLAVTLTHKFDIIHTYHPFGSNALSAADVSITKRANTILLTNWKPADPWVNGDGSNATVNANIDQMARSIKALGSTKIMLDVYHEPENNVSVNNCAPNAQKAASGSPAQYVAMWHNVRARFDALGVTNVVWVMNYMGYSGWNCLVNQMWPGNSYVDWIMFDPYGSGSSYFNASVSPFYNYLTANSNAAHDYLSKTWGLGEYGYGGKTSTEAGAIQYFVDAKNSIANNTFPRLKAYNIFDTNVNGDSQVGLDFSGAVNLSEQTSYNSFINSVLAKQSSGSTPLPSPTVAPTPNPTVAPSPKPSSTTGPSPTPTPATNFLTGDINTDGHVNAADLAILLSHWNQSVKPNTNGDFNSDGKVTTIDLAMLLSNWGK